MAAGVALALAAGPRDARAQGEVRPASRDQLQTGDRVRFQLLESVDGSVTRAARCTGWLAQVAGDTLVLVDAGRCPRGAIPPGAVADLRVARGDRGARSTHTFLGLLGGAAAGGLLGRVVAGDGCRIPSCADGEYAVAILTILGTGTGAVVGTVVGLALPAGPRWVRVATARPVRVAGLALRPGLRLARGSPRL